MVQSAVTLVTKFQSVLIFADERIKIFRVDLFSRGSKKLCFTCINFRRKYKNAQNRRILHKRKLSENKETTRKYYQCIGFV